MKHIAIFASGTGSNARKIVDYFRDNEHVKVNLIISNNANAPVLEMAKDNGIDTFIINRDYFYDSTQILSELNTFAIDFIALAGFLWLIPTYLVNAYNQAIVNIHPALLPKYGGKGMYGMNVHKAVYEAKEKETGITIHFVNEKYDEGAIIFQATCSISPEDTPKEIAKKVLQLEHQYFSKVIDDILMTTNK